MLAIKNFITLYIDPKSVHSDYFYHKKSFFEQHGNHNYHSVFIGDSITDNAEWEDLFPSIKIANRGIGGDRTDGVLKRLDSIYSTHARKAFIMIGINDLKSGREINDILKNYKEITSSLANHGIHTYIQSTLFTGNKDSNLNKRVNLLNIKLNKLSINNDTITYIDLNSALASNYYLDEAFSRDGIHLNGEGYRVWKEVIKNYIME
ncbi:MAG: GDSL-type esterase/lipase family protein [Gammaproteobacteria bacterium]|nr:GDSL-type esterase/lipase family protein [Gammaproteobacteria bacterium]